MRNKKTLLIAGILLLVIGISFAYYVMQVYFSGKGSMVDATTAYYGDITVHVDAEDVTLGENTDILPGHTVVSKLTVTATGPEKAVGFNLLWNVDEAIPLDERISQVNYTIYKTTDSSINIDSTCERVIDSVGDVFYYYETCELTNVNNENVIEVVSKEDNKTILSADSTVTLLKGESIVASESGNVAYYYVVLEYPDLDYDQSEDQGKYFKGEISITPGELAGDVTIATTYLLENGEYVESATIPEKGEGYVLNQDKSSCGDSTLLWNEDDWEIEVTDINGNLSCELYFDEACGAACQKILTGKTIEERSSFSSVLTSDTNGKIYSVAENGGTSYYFAGATTQNYVKFAGFYWRIVRINYNGTIRMIYLGTTSIATGKEARISGTVNYTAKTNFGETNYIHVSSDGSTEASLVNEEVDAWYKSNLLGTDNEKYIDINTGFCEDSDYFYNSGSEFRYMGYKRMYSNRKPSLECSNDNLYTVSNSSIGNKLLTYPIGLISADEVAYAGGKGHSTDGSDVNKKYYLYTSAQYWTMTPSRFKTSFSQFVVQSDGGIAGESRSGTAGVRPVINLRADVNLKGSGTSTSPYEIVVEGV